jgi:hypothetical protein
MRMRRSAASLHVTRRPHSCESLCKQNCLVLLNLTSTLSWLQRRTRLAMSKSMSKDERRTRRVYPPSSRTRIRVVVK